MNDFILVEQGRLPNNKMCKNLCDNGVLGNCELKHKGIVKEFFAPKMFKSFDEFIRLRSSPIFKCFNDIWVIAHNCKKDHFLTIKGMVKNMERKNEKKLDGLITRRIGMETIIVKTYQEWGKIRYYKRKEVKVDRFEFGYGSKAVSY